MASSRLQSGPRTIQVPRSLLFSTDLTPATKLLWIRLRFDELRHGKRSHRPQQLAKRTNLARSTIYEALRQGTATGWFVPYVDPVSGKRRWKTACPARDRQVGLQKPRGAMGETQGRVRGFQDAGSKPRGDAHNARRDERQPRLNRERRRDPWIPVDLIRAAHSLRPQAILCFGLLQATGDFKGRTGTFRWVELHELTRLHLRTIKRAVRELADARWISITQKDRRSPVQFRLQHADEAYMNETVRNLERAGFVGEALMRSFLSLITDTKECEDWARPEFLVNPASGERMELDRYYPLHRVAFEFNGKQHYVASGPFTKKDVAAQKKRDQIKQRICKERKIDLVVVHAEDLSLLGMIRKVGSLLPRRALRGFRETIRYLNRCGYLYQRAAKRE